MTRPLEDDALDLWCASQRARDAARNGDNYGIGLTECAALSLYQRHPNPHVRAIASDPEELYRKIETGPEAA